VLLQRHGGAIRADLARYYGADLLDVFRGTMTPDACWDLVAHLPRESALHSALADDPDAVGELNPAPAAPSLAEFPPVVEALASVHDLLASLLAVQVSRGGGQPPKIPPYPRPVTAAQRAASRARRDRHRALVARLLPGA
jgi:hypothetical protein